MFITFEGLDFCGKSTQVKLLKQYLIDLGQKVELIREPGGTTISEKIRKILLDRENSKMTIEAELLLFSASRAQLVREIIIPLLKENYYVISDRFHDSSIAYQGFGRGIDVHKVKEIQEFAIDGAIPEITFFIDIPIEEVKSRREKFEPESWDRIEVSLDDFYERVRAGYISLSHNNKRFILLDGLKSIEQIHDEVVKAIESYNRL
ncbi:MAG: dTMP kinase [Bacteroidetes bacterium]|nr:dTMP kinase [Bacteroidota bacterium]